jgi:FlaA1/EpsC-like NDP-sugar epimerase
LLLGPVSTLHALSADVGRFPGVQIAGWVLTDASTAPSVSFVGECGDPCCNEADFQPRPAASLPTHSGSLDSLDTFLAGLPRRPDGAILALPTGPQHRRAVRSLERAGIPVAQLPSTEDLLAGLVSTTAGVEQPPLSPPARQSGVFMPRSIDYARLIGREPYEADAKAVARVLTGKRVVITGAGGSIGSELVRVACAYAPEQIILVERSENALFEIDRQIASRFPKIKRKAVLHDVVDAQGTLGLMRSLQPHVVFHAAAHKHVPLMEDHPGHAITNNLFGTKAIADAAVDVGCERFVMISSDKAVNPASVMGATKRLAELYIRHLAASGPGSTRLSMVRFGNVLGSACSVLTIWGSQLAEGGPITVTDPRMTRYFMTIPEAATLVIQSAALPAGSSDVGGGGGGVYVLDMGQPARILDLAARFIQLHGFKPRVRPETLDPALRSSLQSWLESMPDIFRTGPNEHAEPPTVDITFSGIRPGEKLYEELAYAAEMLRPTDHPGVQAWAGEGRLGDIPLMLKEMGEVRFSADRSAIISALQRHVPEMRRGNVPSDA